MISYVITFTSYMHRVTHYYLCATVRRLCKILGKISRVSAHTCFGLVALVSRALSTSALVKFKQTFEHTVFRVGLE